MQRNAYRLSSNFDILAVLGKSDSGCVHCVVVLCVIFERAFCLAAPLYTKPTAEGRVKFYFASFPVYVMLMDRVNGKVKANEIKSDSKNSCLVRLSTYSSSIPGSGISTAIFPSWNLKNFEQTDLALNPSRTPTSPARAYSGLTDVFALPICKWDFFCGIKPCLDAIITHSSPRCLPESDHIHP